MGGGQGQSSAVVSRMFTAAQCTMSGERNVSSSGLFFVIFVCKSVFFFFNCWSGSIARGQRGGEVLDLAGANRSGKFGSRRRHSA